MKWSFAYITTLNYISDMQIKCSQTLLPHLIDDKTLS